jgi:hypothetical protein
MHNTDLSDQLSSLRSIDNIAYSASKSSSSVGSDEQMLARFGKRQQFKVWRWLHCAGTLYSNWNSADLTF